MTEHPHLIPVKLLLAEAGKKVVVTTHPRPDADALGSSLGLKLYLEKLGHEVTVITPTDYPRFLKWMKDENQVVNFETTPTAYANALIASADIIFCLDFANLNRIAKLGEVIAKASGIKILIDHHLDPDPFYDYAFWDKSASSTCELIFRVISAMDHANLIDLHTAECIYAGILTDSGNFRHPTTSRQTHLIVADLMKTGLVASKIHKLIYDNNPEGRLRLLGKVLSENLIVHLNYRTAYMVLRLSDIESNYCDMGDTEGFVNYALSIDGILFGAIFIERKEGTKVSFRSVGKFSVNEFARNHFGGGGHQNAAGGFIAKTLEESVQYFEQLLPNYASELNYSIDK